MSYVKGVYRTDNPTRNFNPILHFNIAHCTTQVQCDAFHISQKLLHFFVYLLQTSSIDIWTANYTVVRMII